MINIHIWVISSVMVTICYIMKTCPLRHPWLCTQVTRFRWTLAHSSVAKFHSTLLLTSKMILEITVESLVALSLCVPVPDWLFRAHHLMFRPCQVSLIDSYDIFTEIWIHRWCQIGSSANRKCNLPTCYVHNESLCSLQNSSWAFSHFHDFE